MKIAPVVHPRKLSKKEKHRKNLKKKERKKEIGGRNINGPNLAIRKSTRAYPKHLRSKRFLKPQQVPFTRTDFKNISTTETADCKAEPRLPKEENG